MVGAFIILCTVNVPLTLITFAVLPFLVLFIIKKRSAMTMAFRKNRIEIAEVNASLGKQHRRHPRLPRLHRRARGGEKVC